MLLYANLLCSAAAESGHSSKYEVLKDTLADTNLLESWDLQHILRSGEDLLITEDNQVITSENLKHYLNTLTLRYHPDKTTNEEEKIRRTPRFVAIINTRDAMVFYIKEREKRL